MAFVTNGDYRQTTLTVRASVNNVEQTARQHSILAAFPGPDGTAFQKLEPVDFARLTEALYQHRLGQFLLWVKSQEHAEFDPAVHITNKAFGSASEPGAPIACVNNA